MKTAIFSITLEYACHGRNKSAIAAMQKEINDFLCEQGRGEVVGKPPTIQWFQTSEHHGPHTQLTATITCE